MSKLFIMHEFGGFPRRTTFFHERQAEKKVAKNRF
jgi:hypothetical protein